MLGGIVSSRGGKLFVQQQSAYWSSQQAEVVPRCRVNPKSAKDVSAAILITRFYECPFAVKSGGHAAFAGASNIGDGMTIDLSSLKSIKISYDRRTTQVGAGNRWIDVYETLTPHNLSAVGGRVAGIGVGGLTLGG